MGILVAILGMYVSAAHLALGKSLLFATVESRARLLDFVKVPDVARHTGKELFMQ
jgi:hypothetical protein